VSGDGGRGVAREVVNPDHTELVALLADVRAYQGLNADLLGLPARVMGTGGAWTGPHTAEVFAAELQGRHANLPRRFDGLVDKVAHDWPGSLQP